MKKILKNYAGFTLIELLVVVAIIAILSVIGMALFTTAQSNARDGRRRSDIDAIAAALEVNKVSPSLTYTALAGTQFASGTIPADPTTNKKYCYTASIATPAIWTTACVAPWTDVSSATVVPGSGVSLWTVCASLESGSGSVYCKSSSQ